MPKFDKYAAVITPAGTDLFLVKQGDSTKILTLSQIEEFYPRCLPLKTGQETSYHADDDGDLEKGVARSYTVLTTGDQSGTTNITINGKTGAVSNNVVKDNRTALDWQRFVAQSDIGPGADGKLFWDQWTLENKTDISFINATGKIHSVAGEFSADALCVGRKFTVTGSGSNDGTYTVSAIDANDITTVEGVADEAAGDTVTIATVDDLIWDFLAQANANSLGGYADWQIPNKNQLNSLVDIVRYNPCINTTAFPSTPSTYFWTSSTRPGYTSSAFLVVFTSGHVYDGNKARYRWCVRLVRG